MGAPRSRCPGACRVWRRMAFRELDTSERPNDHDHRDREQYVQSRHAHVFWDESTRSLHRPVALHMNVLRDRRHVLEFSPAVDVAITQAGMQVGLIARRVATETMYGCLVSGGDNLQIFKKTGTIHTRCSNSSANPEDHSSRAAGTRCRLGTRCSSGRPVQRPGEPVVRSLAARRPSGASGSLPSSSMIPLPC